MFKWLVGKFAPGETVPIGVKNAAGNIVHLTLDAFGNIPVSVSGAGSGGTSSNFGAAFPAAGTAAGATDGANMQPLHVDGSGNLNVNVKVGGSAPVLPSTSTLTNVVANNVSVTLLAANASRLGALVVNDDPAVVCLIKYGAVASASSYTVRLMPNDSFQLPSPCYTGRIDAIWASAPSGNARVTELTP